MFKQWILSFKKNTITTKVASPLKCLQKRKKNEIYVANEVYGFTVFSTGLGRILGSKVGNGVGVMLRRIGPQKLEFV